MSSQLLRPITAEESQQFLRDGVVCLRQIFSPEWLATVREGVEELRSSPSPYSSIVDGGGIYAYVDQMPSLFNAKLRRVALESGANEIAKELQRCPQMRWWFDQLFYKGSGNVVPTPWHQDTPYSYLDGANVVRVWIPLDPIPRQTAIEVVRGSHLWNVEYATTEVKVFEENKEFAKEQKFSYSNRQAEAAPSVPDVDAHRDSFDIIGYAVEPGDIVVFNYHVLHHAGAGVNPNATRRALAIVYADETSKFKQRPNMVPSVVEHAGKTWQQGQGVADFPELFPLV